MPHDWVTRVDAPKRILVIDDQHAQLNQHAGIVPALVANGFAVETLHFDDTRPDALEHAVQAVQAGHYDAMLTDLQCRRTYPDAVATGKEVEYGLGVVQRLQQVGWKKPMFVHSGMVEGEGRRAMDKALRDAGVRCFMSKDDFNRTAHAIATEMARNAHAPTCG